MSSESPVSCCTRVFWDAVDFPFPKDLAPETIYKRMKLSLEEKMGFMGDLSIMAYVNSENLPDKSAYESARGFNIISHQERHRFMLRDIAWWEVDSTYTSTFRFRGPSEVTFVVISSLSEEESIFLTFLESLKSACYNVRLVVPDDDNLHASPKLLDKYTLSFEWLYHCLLQTGDHLGDPKRMKMTREVVQTTTPPEPIPRVHCPALFLDLHTLPLRACCDPVYITSYVRRAAMGYFDGDFSVMAYVDDPVYTSFPDGWVDAFTECGITIIPQLADAHRMSVDIVLWAMDHPATYFHPRDLLVFSENVKEGTDFYNALKALGERYYNVCVLLPPPSLGSDVMYRQVFSNHMPRISREEDAIGFSSGLASLYHQDFDMSQIHVFCDAPTDISIILPALREKGYHGRVLFRPYQADEPLLGYSDLVYTRVPSIKVQGDSYAVSARMLLDILFWAMNHDDLPENLILVSQPSKDMDIVVQALEHRGFNIIFKPSDDEVASHTINDRFESLCKSPPVAANQIRTITDVSRKLKGCPVIIFWLVDSCPFGPYEFRRKFRSTLEDKGYAGYVLSVTAYVVKGVNTDEEIKVCKKSGLQVRITPQADEYGKFSSMLLDMINWTQHCQAPFNFLVISDPFKDAVCDSVFADVISRGFNVFCETVDYMVTFGSSLWSAERILDTSSSDS